MPTEVGALQTFIRVLLEVVALDTSSLFEGPDALSAVHNVCGGGSPSQASDIGASLSSMTAPLSPMCGDVEDVIPLGSPRVLQVSGELVASGEGPVVGNYPGTLCSSSSRRPRTVLRSPRSELQ
jgi:hypothetical protein